jgi:NADH pyrophosphatase NudC (nudix superfamily)
MARYIDADKADVERISCFYGAECRIEDVKEWLDEQPTADVAEVIHAKWIINSDGYYPYCSNCKEIPEYGVMSKYCPECGAKMDKE